MPPIQTASNTGQLSHIFTEDPQAIADSLRSKELVSKTIAIVSWVALIVIFTGISAIWLGLLVLPEWAVISGFATALLAGTQGTPQWKEGMQHSEGVAYFQKIASKLQELEQWPEDKVLQFFAEQRVNPEPPFAYLKSSLPVIAQFLVLQELADEKKDVMMRNFGKSREFRGLGNNEIASLHHKYGVDAHAKRSPLQLQSAVLLQYLHRPTTEYYLDETGLYEEGQIIGIVHQSPFAIETNLVGINNFGHYKEDSFHEVEPRNLRTLIFG